MISVPYIQRIVARYYGLTMDELIGPRRFPHHAHPRQVAMLLCREFTRASLPRIAQQFGGRNHTTIISGVRAAQQRNDNIALLRFTIENAALCAELDTLPMRVYSAQAQQAKWGDDAVPQPVPPPPPVSPSRPPRSRRREKPPPAGIDAFRTDVPVPSALYP